MKLRSEDVTRAIAVMKQSIPFFPEEVLGVQVVQRLIERFVSTREELESLVQVACETMERWSIPAFKALRTAAADQAYYEREVKENDRKLREWKEEAKLLGAGPEPFPITAGTAKQIPGEVPPTPPAPKPVKRIPSLREAEAELTEQLTQAKRRSEEETARMLADLELQLGVKKPADTQ